MHRYRHDHGLFVPKRCETAAAYFELAANATIEYLERRGAVAVIHTLAVTSSIAFPVTMCPVVSCRALSCPIMSSFRAVSCRVVPCRAVPYPVVPRHVPSYRHTVPCLVL